MSVLRKIAIASMIMMIFTSYSSVTMGTVCFGSNNPNIDLFTQKGPYDGKGPNMPSDAFGPGETAQIYALVTYGGDPVQDVMVAFRIFGPENPIENITVYRVATTNRSGIATISYRIPLSNQTAFGEWRVIGSASIASMLVQDQLFFEVGWIVEIVSLRTVNEDHIEQREFTRGSLVGIDLVLKNIAMVAKTTTIVITIYDSMSIPIASTELRDLVIQPNATPVSTSLFLYIPASAHIGNATVYASAYMTFPDGIPYCPEVSKNFLVVDLMKHYYLTVVTDPFQLVYIAGEGWYNEGTNVTLSAPQHAFISPDTRYSFIYWNVDGTPIIDLSTTVTMDANHTATAHYILQYYLTINSPYGTPTGAGWYDAGLTTYAALDTDILDHGNGTRRIFTGWSGDTSGTYYAQSNPILMNNPKTVTANWKTQFYLTVRTYPPGIATISGEDWYDEFANVTINAPAVSGYNFRFWDVNGALLDGAAFITVHMDAPKTVIAHYTRVTVTMYTLRIIADAGGTTVPQPGTYSYTANSVVQIEAVPNVNYIFSRWELDGVDVGSTNPRTVLMDGNHTLRAVFSPAPAAWFVPLDWFYGLLLLALGLIIILLILWFYVRRRRRNAEEAFHSGWTAWYYFYDLRSGNRKIRKL